MLRWLPSLIDWFAKQQPGETPARSSNPASAEDGEDSTKKSFFEHLEDLRRALIRSSLVLFIGFNVCLVFADRILFFLEAPLRKLSTNPENFLQSLNVTDSFVLAMRLSFYGGLILTMPAILYYLADFILPALNRKERRLLIPAFVSGTLLFVAGVAVCYYAMIPQTLKAFIAYSEWLHIKPQWTVSSYISFVTQFMLSVGITAEMPLVILMLVRLGVVSASTVVKSRKIMIVAAAILAAVLAPPDPLSMIMMMLPLVAMLEITIQLTRFFEKPSPPQDPENRDDR